MVKYKWKDVEFIIYTKDTYPLMDNDAILGSANHDVVEFCRIRHMWYTNNIQISFIKFLSSVSNTTIRNLTSGIA
jgi:hypothetical protein